MITSSFVNKLLNMDHYKNVEDDIAAFKDLTSTLRESKKKTCMIIGHGSKNKIQDFDEDLGGLPKDSIANKIVQNLYDEITDKGENNANVIYFGDSPTDGSIGCVFQRLSEIDAEAGCKLTFYMIQIRKAQGWGFPNFVDLNFWHSNFVDGGENEWGGVDKKGNPQSNTYYWNELAEQGLIHKLFILGGGPITMSETKLAVKHIKDITYYPVQRKFKGDRKTHVPDDADDDTKFGIMHDPCIHYRQLRDTYDIKVVNMYE